MSKIKQASLKFRHHISFLTICQLDLITRYRIGRRKMSGILKKNLKSSRHVLKNRWAETSWGIIFRIQEKPLEASPTSDRYRFSSMNQFCHQIGRKGLSGESEKIEKNDEIALEIMD